MSAGNSTQWDVVFCGIKGLLRTDNAAVIASSHTMLHLLCSAPSLYMLHCFFSHVALGAMMRESNEEGNSIEFRSFMHAPFPSHPFLLNFVFL